MASNFRDFYTAKDPEVIEAISSALIEHRDFIYREYLDADRLLD